MIDRSIRLGVVSVIIMISHDVVLYNVIRRGMVRKIWCDMLVFIVYTLQTY